VNPSELAQRSEPSSLAPGQDLNVWLRRAGVVFVLSRLLFFALGVRFISGQLQAWQFIDPELLRHDLLRSVFYQHSQPPLFNLLTGAGLQLAGAASSLLFQSLFLVCGLALYLAQLTLMVRLGVAHKLAFIISTWFVLSPSVVCYENWFFYTFPLAALLLLAALALLDFVETGRALSGRAFFAVVAIACLTQSTFHPLLLPLIVGACWWSLPRLRQVVLRAAAVPLLLVLALVAKNAILFGSVGSSTWLGMSLARVVMVNVPEAERQALVDQGRMSTLALIEPFDAVERYPQRFQRPSGFAAVPVLQNARKSTGETNYNHVAFIQISKQYLRDCLVMIRTRPLAYVKGMARSWFVYTKSTADYGWLIDNRTRLGALDELYSRLFYGRVRIQTSVGHVRGAEGQPFDVYVLLILGLPLLVLYGAWSCWSRRSMLNAGQRAAIGFCCVAIVYVAVLGNALESGENNRFRFMTDGLSFCVLAVLVQRLVQQREQKKLPARAAALSR